MSTAEPQIRRAAVLGAGVMGSQIAAHLANVGIPTLLLDLVPPDAGPHAAARNRLAAEAIGRLRQMSPAPLYLPERAELIAPGNFDDDLQRVREADWVIEAVVEKLEAKRELWRRVEPHLSEQAICSTNTSGISVRAICEGLSSAVRRRFLGTHFFNPPRYLRLLEVVPTGETDPAVTGFVAAFAERVLGKGVVTARDTPNFIANRIGTYALLVALRAMAEHGLGVDDVDLLTGPLIGRPKSATFRTLDIVGLDTFLDVARNCLENVSDPAERRAFEPPATLREMVRRGWTGQKAGQGFYKRVAGEGKQTLVLDLQSMEYRPARKPSFPSVEAAKALPDAGARLAALVAGDDAAARFLWQTTRHGLLYAAERAAEIAPDISSIDRAMRLGFNWRLGPFETWDALGVRATVERMKREGERVPAWVEAMLAAGGESFYRPAAPADGGAAAADRLQFAPAALTYQPLPEDPRALDLARLRAAGRLVRGNDGASLVDLGDGVLGLEMHSPKDAIGPDLLEMIDAAAEEVQTRWRGLVICSRSDNFCVGANLFMIAMGIASENWSGIEAVVRQVQNLCMKLKYLPRPVVAAPFGLCLGGGAEIAFGAAVIQASAETYFGLVETGVGLIPAGGGTKELLLRAIEGLPPGADLQSAVGRAFETIAMARVSTSALEARSLGYFRPTDRISVNPGWHLHEAKRVVLELDAAGYRPPVPRRIPVLGPDGRAVLELGVYNLLRGRHISEHDALIGKKLARVLTGGEVSRGTEVSEQYLLDLEREAFLSLCGEPKTRARIEHMLATGKPLRN